MPAHPDPRGRRRYLSLLDRWEALNEDAAVYFHLRSVLKLTLLHRAVLFILTAPFRLLARLFG